MSAEGVREQTGRVDFCTGPSAAPAEHGGWRKGCREAHRAPCPSGCGSDGASGAAVWGHMAPWGLPPPAPHLPSPPSRGMEHAGQGRLQPAHQAQPSPEQLSMSLPPCHPPQLQAAHGQAACTDISRFRRESSIPRWKGQLGPLSRALPSLQRRPVSPPPTTPRPSAWRAQHTGQCFPPSLEKQDQKRKRESRAGQGRWGVSLPLAGMSGRTLSLGLSQPERRPSPAGRFLCVCVCVCVRAHARERVLLKHQAEHTLLACSRRTCTPALPAGRQAHIRGSG